MGAVQGYESMTPDTLYAICLCIAILAGIADELFTL